MNFLLYSYRDMMLTVGIGQKNGRRAISKPLYILALIDAIEEKSLKGNVIPFDNEFLRKRFGRLYELYNHSPKGYELSFFIRPFYHLGSSEFYHLLWKPGVLKPENSHTPSGKYLKEYLLYAHFDDELWQLLQDAENRNFIRHSIISRFLSN